MLELTRSVHHEMVAHAWRGLPHEACGLFTGAYGTDRVERFRPMTNTAASELIYTLDGAEMLAVEREADEAGQAVLGVMHSHTRTTAYPSPTDVADAARFDPFGTWRFIIVSLKHPFADLRCYRILEGVITEEAIALIKD